MKNLLGTVVPADATNKLIEWSVKYSGTTNVGYYTEETHVYENGQLIAITEYGFSALKTGIYVLTATITDGLATGTDYTQDFSITVTASTDITAHPQAAGYTIDETPAALSVTATPQNSGTLSYQWYSNTADNNTTGTLITGETVSSYTPPTGTAGTTYYYVEITNTKTGWETTTVTSQTAAITVTTATPPVDAETPVISGQPQSVTVSVNAPASLSVTAGVSDGGALSYQWYSNTSGSNTGGTPITGATVSSYSPSTAATGARWYYVTVTNTNNSASGVKTAGVTSNAAAVTVEAVIPAPATTYTITVAPSANGQVTATPQNAEAGETVTLTITPAEGYEPEALVIHRTNAENETIAPSGEGNVRTFTMPGFAVTVRASFRPTTPTGTEPLAQPTPLSAYVQNGRLYITGLTPGQSWSLYSITGALISNKTPTTSEAELSLPARGIYIIHSGNNTIKVVN
jgi:hypothetical protein